MITQTTKLTLTYNGDISAFETPFLPKLQAHGISQEEYHCTVNNLSNKVSKNIKKKNYCTFGICCFSAALVVAVLVLGFLILGLMIMIPKFAQDQIKEALEHGEAETLFISGSEQKDVYIKQTIKELNLRAKIFEHRPTPTEITSAFSNYYYVYIKTLNELSADDKTTLCENLKKTKHVTFLGGISSSKSEDSERYYKSLSNCRSNTQYIKYLRFVPQKYWTHLIILVLSIHTFIALMSIGIYILAAKCIKKEMKNIEKESKDESLKKYQSRGVHFQFNSNYAITPEINIFFYEYSATNNQKQAPMTYYQHSDPGNFYTENYYHVQ
eukprot:gene7900-12368_t